MKNFLNLNYDQTISIWILNKKKFVILFYFLSNFICNILVQTIDIYGDSNLN